MKINDNIKIFRDLAHEYKEICENPRQKELKSLWRKHNSLIKTEIPVVCSWDEGSNLFCELLRADLICTDERLKMYEIFLRNSVYHNKMADDKVYIP